MNEPQNPYESPPVMAEVVEEPRRRRSLVPILSIILLCLVSMCVPWSLVIEGVLALVRQGD